MGGRDVFIHRKQMGDLEVGEEITFVCEVNKDGMPQARDILCADGSKPDSGVPREKKKKDVDSGGGGKGKGKGGKGKGKATNEVPQVLPPKFGAGAPAAASAKPRF